MNRAAPGSAAGNELDQAGLLIVGLPGDRLAALLRRVAAERGQRVGCLSVAAAAQQLTTSFSGHGVEIEPCLPIFLRSVSHAQAGEDQDQAFARREAIAHLWATCALSPRPVVNRPSLYGLAGLTGQSLVVTERAWGGQPPPQEVFFSSASEMALAAPGCVQDLGSLQARATPIALSGPGPWRMRHMPSRLFDLVVVVAGRAWRHGPPERERLALEARSVALARALGLVFTTVTWAIDDAGSEAVLARIDAYPHWHQVERFAQDIGGALCDHLLA